MKSFVSWAFSPAWRLLSRRRMLALPILFLLAAVAVSAAIALFRVYGDDTGRVQTKSSNPSTLNATNPFFDPSIVHTDPQHKGAATLSIFRRPLTPT